MECQTFYLHSLLILTNIGSVFDTFYRINWNYFHIKNSLFQFFFLAKKNYFSTVLISRFRSRGISSFYFLLLFIIKEHSSIISFLYCKSFVSVYAHSESEIIQLFTKHFLPFSFAKYITLPLITGIPVVDYFLFSNKWNRIWIF